MSSASNSALHRFVLIYLRLSRQTPYVLVHLNRK